MAARKGRGSRLSRSEVVTVRLDPKLRFAAELAARKQRRTLSSLIEWAIEDALGRYPVTEDQGFGDALSALDLANRAWDVDEPDRFAGLALQHAEFLTHEEQILWKLIRENGWLWKGRFNDQGEWEWKIEQSALRRDQLRKHWELFRQVALGEQPIEKLPRWMRKRGDSGQKGEEEAEGEANIEDDIPF